MKKIILLLIIIAISHSTFAQIPTLDTNNCFNNGDSYIDTLYTLCDTIGPNTLQLEFDTNTNNLWQMGSSTKFGISSARDSACSIITDTLNPYPINNYSAFHCTLPPNSNGSWGNGYMNYYVKFWHRFDTDSLYDGCWIEFSNDSGMTWENIDSFGLFSIASCNLYNNNLSSSLMDTIQGGRKAWSGNSNGWRHTALLLNIIIPLKPKRSTPINMIRFVFASDSIHHNKPGWSIDDIAIGYVYMTDIDEVTQFQQLPVYPNPSSNGVFTISTPKDVPIKNLQVYDIMGNKIQLQQNSNSIDLSKQINGIYYYRLEIDKTIYRGVLQKE